MLDLLQHITLWHWVAAGLLLLSIEMAVGTFDLLWIAIGAMATALFAWLVPAPVGGWQGQLVFFAVVAIALVVAGRTVFSGLRRTPTAYPNLNDRTATLIGQHGAVDGDFVTGRGQVKVGDTVWLAVVEDEAELKPGEHVTVTGVEGTTLRVRRRTA